MDIRRKLIATAVLTAFSAPSWGQQVQPSEDGILLAVKLDYTVPQPLLKKHTEEAILHQNERAIEDVLTNLKSLLETHDARTLDSV